jgi:hypothetical protein
MKDLRNRVILQQQLWKCVYQLRAGHHYDPCALEFLNAIQACRMSNYEAPELMYIGDEGRIFSRIISSFSLNPTIIATITQRPSTNMYGAQQIINLSITLPIPRITRISIIPVEFEFPTDPNTHMPNNLQPKMADLKKSNDGASVSSSR